MNTKVHFWCRETGKDTAFYSLVTDKDINEYLPYDLDDFLISEKVVEDLQRYSEYGILDNWGVVKWFETNEPVRGYKIDKSLGSVVEKDYLTKQELEVNRLRLYDDHSKLKYEELLKFYDNLLTKTIDIAEKLPEVKKDDERQKLLDSPKFTSESGWITRTGRWYNVKSVDHENVAKKLWGGIWTAEKNNIRVSSSAWGIYVLFDFRNSNKLPNEKQLTTLREWGEKFKEEKAVKDFIEDVDEFREYY